MNTNNPSRQRINPIALLKRAYGGSISSQFLDPADFSFKELHLFKEVFDSKLIFLKKIIHSLNEPDIYIYTADAARHLRLKLQASGKSFFSEKKAILAAVGEAVERFRWCYYRPVSVVRSVSDMGERAVDMSLLTGFSEEQRNMRPSLRYSDDSMFHWTRVPDLAFGTRRFLPTQLISPSFFLAHTRAGNEPLLRGPISSGAAAGWSEGDIVYRGICESIERDAFMITYLNKITPVKIDLNSTRALIHGARMDLYFKKFNLEAHSVLLISDLPPYSVMSLIVDRSGDGPALSVGACADFNIEDAIVRSLEEAACVRLFSKAFQLHRKDAAISPAGFLSAEDRKIYWSKPENLRHIDFMIQGKKKNISNIARKDIEEKKSESTQDKIRFLLSSLKQAGYHCFYANMAPRNSVFSLRSGIVFIPELQPLYLDETFACHGAERLWKVPQKLGYGAGRPINPVPHPFH